MIRRRALLAALALSGCGLSERPYEARRTWPLTVLRPGALPPRRGGAVLEVRSFREGPGMAARGLQTLRPDGSLDVAFYEEWLVPPTQAVEDALRAWLAASGRFAAVLAPGSRATADIALEGELDALLSAPAAGVARAALGVVAVREGAAGRVLFQRRIATEAKLPGPGAAEAVRAQEAALAEAFAQIEALLG